MHISCFHLYNEIIDKNKLIFFNCSFNNKYFISTNNKQKYDHGSVVQLCACQKFTVIVHKKQLT